MKSMTKTVLIKNTLAFFALVQTLAIGYLIAAYLALSKIQELEKQLANSPKKVLVSIPAVESTLNSNIEPKYFFIGALICLTIVVLGVVFLTHSGSPAQDFLCSGDVVFKNGKCENVFNFREQSSGLDVVFKTHKDVCSVNIVSKADGSHIPLNDFLACRNIPLFPTEERMLEIITQIWS